MRLSKLLRQAADFDPDQIQKGLKVEKEHASTIQWLKDNPDATLEQALEHISKDHLKEIGDYYDWLDLMEGAAKAAKNGDATKQAVLKFFAANPNPEDAKVHELAASLKLDPDELEDQIYALLTELLKGKKGG